jgi:hypothetical protein
VKLGQLVQLVKEMVSKIENLEGYLFLDRFDEGREQLLEKIAKYDSPCEAQKWMNIVLVDQAITALVGENWELDDVEISAFLDAMELAWSYQIKACFAAVEYRIFRIIDDEYGDVGLRLTSENASSEKHG